MTILAESVAHAWAHQTNSHRKGGAVFYDGATIYSYGRHFPIARLVKAGNGTVIFFTTRKYSNTTSKHCGIVRAAVSHMTIFEMARPDSDDHAANYSDMVQAASELVEKAKRARSAGDRYLSEASDVLENGNRYAALFGLRRPVLSLDSLGVAVADIEARMRRARAKAARDKAAADARRFVEQEEARQAWLAGESRHWRGSAADGSALLRIVHGAIVAGAPMDSGDMLETSQGAFVPLAHAIRAFRFVKAVRERGEDWKRNGAMIRVGHFQIDSISAAGDIVAGCHRIAWPEVERIAALAGVADLAPSADAVERTPEHA